MSQALTFQAEGPAARRVSLARTRAAAHAWWHDATPRTRSIVQLSALLVLVLIAYNYSLDTLWQNAGLETPLAYVSLVPAIALALAAVRARPMKPEPAIHDRQVDYILGLPLMAGALAANYLLPEKLSAMFWVWRIDLLTLPFFVAGAVAIIFGTRVLWRQKLAVSYLFLAWPYPYQSVLLRILDGFTNATLFGIKEILRVVKVATPINSGDGTIFSIVHHGQSFPLSVVSACSGVNSVVGFLLIGTAFGAVVRGPILRKVLWLVGGMALLWAINLGRITFIFWAGKTWGEYVSIDILHPFIGLVTFSIGVVLMMLLIHPLGMEIGMAPRAEAAASAHEAPQPAGAAAAPGSLPAVPARSKMALAVPKVYAAIVIVLVAAVLLGANNVNLKTYNLVADASGAPRLDSYNEAPVAPAGWETRLIATYDWAKPLFGDTSEWNRFTLLPTGPGPLDAPVAVVADVITTPDLASFSAYGVEACYQFHGYSLRDVAQVAISGGITGQAMSYTSQQYGSWSIVYWIIPVKQQASTTYERVVLYVRNSGRGVVVPATQKEAGIDNVAGTLDPSDSADLQLIENRDFLVAFARQTITAEADRSAKAAATGSSPAEP